MIRIHHLVLACALLPGCVASAPEVREAPAPSPSPAPATPALSARDRADCCLALGLRIADRHRVDAIRSRAFTHAQLWSALDRVVASPELRVAEIGRSIHGRPLRAVSYGNGPTRVLLWSQMHGDEPTATMALADILSWMTASPAEGPEVRDRIARALTVVMVPMLNPDGAELRQRENAVGVDVNRDARRLVTPEARALKALRDSIRPAFGFNLHDQSARILTGRGGEQVAIALLAPAADSSLEYGPTRAAARLLAAEIAVVLEEEIPGRVARYEDDFNPRAFGDLMQQWGTSTVLIESGGLPNDPEKQRLRAINVAAIVSALDALATGRYATMDPQRYDALPMNNRSAVDVLIRGGTVVVPGTAPLRLDLALNYGDPLAQTGLRLREVGDLAQVSALDTVEASGLFVHPEPSMLTRREGASWLRINAPAALTIRRGAGPWSEPVRTIREAKGVGDR